MSEELVSYLLPFVYVVAGFVAAWYVLRKLESTSDIGTSTKKTIVDIIDYVVLQAVKAAEQAWKVNGSLDRESFALDMIVDLLKQFGVSESDIPTVEAIKKLIYSKVLSLPKSNP